MSGDHRLFVVDGMEVINEELTDYANEKHMWELRCRWIKDSYFQKTTRIATDKAKQNIKEYTYWYHREPTGGIKSCGKDRPDIESEFPPEPVNPIQFDYGVINDRHVVMAWSDFDNNNELFSSDFYVFPISSALVW